MVSLVLYAYSTDEGSSRGIERRCRQDIAYRVITGNQVPDHATIARFIRRHQQSLNELFGAVLRLCARAGLVGSGVVAVDGTKLTPSASSTARRAVTSCRRSFRPRPVGDGGWGASSRVSRQTQRSTGRRRTSALSLIVSLILSGLAPTGEGRGYAKRTANSSAGVG